MLVRYVYYYSFLRCHVFPPEIFNCSLLHFTSIHFVNSLTLPHFTLSGDSRCVLSRGGQAIDLTEDHEPDSVTEKARIRALGGRISWYGAVKNNAPVPGMGVYRVNGNLALSRAIGKCS